MPSSLHRVALTLTLVVGAAPGLPASAQESSGELPVSVERIRSKLEQAPPRPLDLQAVPSFPAVTFKLEVEQRWYMPTLEEQLHGDFDLTPLQRQSQAWASRCCGLDLGALIKPVGRALKRRQERRVRAQITRELAELEAEGKK